jgi:hypothetical protein
MILDPKLMDLVWFIDALLTINMINMNMYMLIYIPTDPDEVFVIVISYKVNDNNEIKSLDFRARKEK